MKLTIGERLNISLLYPQSGSRMDMTIVAKIRQKLNITQREIEAYSIKMKASGANQWYEYNYTDEKEREFSLDGVELLLLKKQILALDEARQFKIEMLEIANKIEAEYEKVYRN